VDSRRNSADSDSNDGHLGARSDREWRRQYGPAIGAEVVQRLPCGWRPDAEAYGSMPSFVLIAEKCFSIGGLNWYSRRSTVPGLRRGKQELAAGTLTPSILVRIRSIIRSKGERNEYSMLIGMLDMTLRAATTF
jgi:hypothetical protein